MSFREYLLYEGIVDIETITLEFLLSNHRHIAEYILSKGMKVLPLFDDYLHHGYYPFYKSVFSGFEIRLQQIVNHVMENDYPIIEGGEQSTIRKIKKMFMMLAEQVPQTPNMSNLYNVLETFFLSQLVVDHSVTYPANGDFLVDGKYLFEVVGHKKSSEQIKDVADIYLAVDDTEIGYHNRIPLWMFGMLY